MKLILVFVFSAITVLCFGQKLNANISAENPCDKLEFYIQREWKDSGNSNRDTVIYDKSIDSLSRIPRALVLLISEKCILGMDTTQLINLLGKPTLYFPASRKYEYDLFISIKDDPRPIYPASLLFIFDEKGIIKEVTEPLQKP